MFSMQDSAFRRSSLLIGAVVLLGALHCFAGSAPQNDGTASAPAFSSVDDSPQTFLGPDSSKSITQPLSPKYLNIFNFGPHSFKVQYPAGSNFTGVNMTVVAVQLTETAFHVRVAGTQFAKSSCVGYYGESGYCIDYQVTCSNANHQQIPCPAATTSYISVESSFDTGQSITNPGLITTPIGTNSWQNILDSFFFQRIDPTAHGHTKGFSEFLVVALGATNAEGRGNFAFEAPLRSQDPRLFPAGSSIAVNFSLTSAAKPGQPVTDAIAGVSVLMVADGQGHAVSHVEFSRQHAFLYSNGGYEFLLPSQGFPAGTYILTLYGNAFSSQVASFTIE